MWEQKYHRDIIIYMPTEQVLYNPKVDNTQKKFIINIDGQEYNFSILSKSVGDRQFFYSVFKPLEFDHVIYISEITDSWYSAKSSMNQIFNEVCQYFELEESNYSDIINFLR